MVSLLMHNESVVQLRCHAVVFLWASFFGRGGDSSGSKICYSGLLLATRIVWRLSADIPARKNPFRSCCAKLSP